VDAARHWRSSLSRTPTRCRAAFGRQLRAAASALPFARRHQGAHRRNREPVTTCSRAGAACDANAVRVPLVVLTMPDHATPGCRTPDTPHAGRALADPDATPRCARPEPSTTGTRMRPWSPAFVEPQGGDRCAKARPVEVRATSSLGRGRRKIVASSVGARSLGFAAILRRDPAPWRGSSRAVAARDAGRHRTRDSATQAMLIRHWPRRLPCRPSTNRARARAFRRPGAPDRSPFRRRYLHDPRLSGTSVADQEKGTRGGAGRAIHTEARTEGPARRVHRAPRPFTDGTRRCWRGWPRTRSRSATPAPGGRRAYQARLERSST